MIRYCLCFLFLSACASKATYTSMNQSAMEEMRIALLDVRQTCGEQRIELQLLEEKIAKLKPAAQTKTSVLDSRMRHLEKTLEKIEADLHQLGVHANQTTQSLVQYKNQIQTIEAQQKAQNHRLDEIVKLKGTLNSISQAISKNSSKKVHIVQSGESLEKIARRYDTSVSSLKQQNQLTNNTIFIGQKLTIPE